jgi:Flp pilus assembly protein TadG
MNGGIRPASFREQRGAVAVEFALILPLMLMLILGIIEFGIGYHSWDTTQNAVREGARLAAVDPSETNIEQRVRGTSSFLNQSQLVVDIECSPPGGGAFAACPAAVDWDEGDIVRIKATYAYDWITPLPGFVGLGANMTMTSQAEARFEGL